MLAQTQEKILRRFFKSDRPSKGAQPLGAVRRRRNFPNPSKRDFLFGTFPIYWMLSQDEKEKVRTMTVCFENGYAQADRFFVDFCNRA